MSVIYCHAHTSAVVLVACIYIWHCTVCISGELVSKSHFMQLQDNSENNLDSVMDTVVQLGREHRCSSTETYQHVSVAIRTNRFSILRQKTDLISRFIMDFGAKEAQPFIPTLLKNIVQSDVQTVGSDIILLIRNQSQPQSIGRHHTSAYRTQGQELTSTVSVLENVSAKMYQSEDDMSATGIDKIAYKYMDIDNSSNKTDILGNWTYPYYSCKYQRWVTTYMVPLANGRPLNENDQKVMGVFYMDIDVSSLDINQCDVEFVDASDDGIFANEKTDANETFAEISSSQLAVFRGTHKCDRNTSKCIFTPGGGWTRGSYTCQCIKGFYSTAHNPVFNGTSVENAWKEKLSINSATYSLVYVCKQCSPGCDNCTDGSPCLAQYNWPFRIALLTISVICVLLTILLMGYVYNYRKLKIIKVSSPIFLCMTLVGCVVMYLEMAAIFPILDVYSCIATKWTRHLGFCITYSALLLKTWRVSLTYRVKSAHKIKLTDKQLLQWLFPILLVMVIYLSTWTVSSPPTSIYIVDYNNLHFKQCTYDWWDHSLAIGEILFLLWGIRVCYTVRNAESFYNEAKHISYAIYNISVVNIIMVTIHLLIFPSAPPDFKYLFGFIRTQLSTTVTIVLVFGPKFYRVIKGQGDVYDNRARARGVTASFSLNGIGLVHEEPTDLYQENEELKEEIQKLASQIEFMKIVHMEMNNRHIKPKVGGYFSPSAVNSTQSPVGKAIYMKFDSSDTPTSRISPAAELISERV
ncbi:hypothetical protein CHUAL_007117 [Chamberlinius hualienensis]